jgi:epoxyqueuosine reductase
LSTILEKLDRLTRAEGFTNFGFAEVTTPFSIDLYDQWLADGFNGEMDYLARHADDKRHPSKFFKKARTAIVVTQSYIPHPDPKVGWPLKSNAGVALYARGRDYHRFFHTRLRQLCAKLKAEYPTEEFYSFTDAGPVLERDLAARAGLGWIGKNTCLIDRERGSLFLLGEIYCSLEVPVAKLSVEDLAKDFCGTCTRCIDACPTGAIVEARKVDARKCISYLTIESKDEAPLGLREQIGSWLFGCDICQVVCPWNVRVHGRETIDSLHMGSEDALVEDLRYLLTAPNRQLERDFDATPLRRINGMGLKRNALVVAGNRRLQALRPEVKSHAEHPRIGELARWALEQMDLSPE